MWMSFLLPCYAGLNMPDGTPCIDYYLTEYCKRGYLDILFMRPGTVIPNTGGATTPADIPTFVALCQRVKRQYGLRIAYWAAGSQDPRVSWPGYQTLAWGPLQALLDGNAVDLAIVGEELNSWLDPGPNGLDGIIQGFCAGVAPYRKNRVRVGVHFTSNYPAYPLAPMSDYDWWNLVGIANGYGVDMLCWQADFNQSPGAIGGRLWDARVRVGNNAVVSAFETYAEAQLYGQKTETDGRRIGYELVCCTRTTGSTVPAVYGFMNGASYGDGSIL
jgi:hypothetical protein